jgi:hypothetical protein
MNQRILATRVVKYLRGVEEVHIAMLMPMLTLYNEVANNNQYATSPRRVDNTRHATETPAISVTP